MNQEKDWALTGSYHLGDCCGVRIDNFIVIMKLCLLRIKTDEVKTFSPIRSSNKGFRPSLDSVLSPHRTQIFQFGAVKAR